MGSKAPAVFMVTREGMGDAPAGVEDARAIRAAFGDVCDDLDEIAFALECALSPGCYVIGYAQNLRDAVDRATPLLNGIGRDMERSGLWYGEEVIALYLECWACLMSVDRLQMTSAARPAWLEEARRWVIAGPRVGEWTRKRGVGRLTVIVEGG